MKSRNAETPKRGNGITPGLTSAPKEEDQDQRVWTFGRLGVWACALTHALLTFAVFPPLDLWPLTFVVPVPLAMLALRAPSTRSALLAVLVAQMLMWLWFFRWIMPVTGVGYPFLALYQSLHFMLLVWALRRVVRSPRLARWPMAILLPMIWTAFEFFRGEIAFNGYPWYLLAHPLINWLSFAQSSDLLGTYFVTFLAAIPAGLAIDFVGWVPPTMTRTSAAHVRGGRCPPYVAIAAIVLLIANVAYGQWRLHQTSTLARGPRVLAIQTNLPQDNKIGWSKDQWALDVPSFIDLTRRALEAAGGPANVDLIVWPETMVPSLGFELQTHAVIDEFNALVGGGEEHRTVWAKRIVTLQRELGVPMLVGSEAWLGARIARQSDGYIRVDRDKVYNSAYLVQGEPPYQRYDKNVLTPFGETMPYISNWKWLEKQFLALGARGMAFDLDSNPDVAALELRAPAQASSLKSQAYRLGTPICFEDCVAWLCRRMAYDASGKRADLLINISNDGWFGSSGADRRLHAEIARFRCIENRLPMVRCVNTGVSVHIDSSGRLVAAAGDGPYGSWGNPGWLLAHVQIDSRRTLFGSIGNSFAGFCGLLALGLILWTFGRRRRPPLASVVLQVKDSP